MFVLRTRASPGWLAANERALCEIGGPQLALTFPAARKKAIAEISNPSRDELEKIRARFGGTIEKLPRDWLGKFLRERKSEAFKVGKRLVITGSGGFGTAVTVKSTGRKPPLLVIPAAAAFGTGEHATTGMTLRLLEKTTRPYKREFSVLDVGTGSGILALAAARFGATRVTAVDYDPVAIATAKKNARRNKIDIVDFHIADVRHWKFPKRIDIITANLFGELLIEIVEKLSCARWSIISGILREQESRMLRALKRKGIAVVERRRRGKWVAILASKEALAD
jgi:ribosomal protein L11 methyltransferase